MQWHTLLTLPYRRLKQEGHEPVASVSNIEIPCLKSRSGSICLWPKLLERQEGCSIAWPCLKITPCTYVKILSKPCCKQMFCHLGFFVSFIAHRIEGAEFLVSSIFGMVSEHWLQLSHQLIIPYQESSCPWKLGSQAWLLSNYPSLTWYHFLIEDFHLH